MPALGPMRHETQENRAGSDVRDDALEFRLVEHVGPDPALESDRRAGAGPRIVHVDDRDAAGPHLLAQSGGQRGDLGVRSGGELEKDRGGAGDDGENVVGGLDRSGDARETEPCQIGGEGAIDGAMAIVDDKHLLQRTHKLQRYPMSCPV